MILTFYMPPLARQQGLCDIDRVWFRVTQKIFKIMESPGTTELTDLSLKGKTRIIGFIPPC